MQNYIRRYIYSYVIFCCNLFKWEKIRGQFENLCLISFSTKSWIKNCIELLFFFSFESDDSEPVVFDEGWKNGAMQDCSYTQNLFVMF